MSNEALELRLKEVEEDVREVKKDLSKINIDMTLLMQRQADNAKAINNVSNTLLTNHTAVMGLLTDISKTESSNSGKLGFIKGVLVIFAASTVGGGTAAVTVGNEELTGFLQLLAKLVL